MADGLFFEPLREAHLDSLAVVLRQPAVYAHIDADVPSPAAFREALTIALAGPPPHVRDETWLNVLVRAHADGPMLGRLEATVHDGLAEVAFLFDPAHWGRGIASRSLAWLHGELARRVALPGGFWATTVPANHRCQALLQRLGYRQVHGPLPPLRSFDPGDQVHHRDVEASTAPDIAR
jgi:RimJ/RimL family protein N-acetyltransferase